MSARTFSLAVAGVLLLGGPALGQPQGNVQSDVRESDLKKAYDLVFLAEGYTEGERDLFFTEARALAARLEAAQAAPVRAKLKFNFHSVFVPSQEAAPWQPGAPPGKTAFKAHLRPDEMFEADDGAAETAATVAPDVDGLVLVTRFAPNAPFVRANADVRPAMRGRLRLPSDHGEALVHELGHTIFGLGDEYCEFTADLPADGRDHVSYYPNLTTDPSGARFAPFAAPPLVEGGMGYPRGVWHAEARCCMNDSTDEFCKLCRALIDAFPQAKPQKPRIVSPADGSKLKSDVAVVASWQPAGGTRPVRYWLNLSQLGENGYPAVWWGGCEGHELSRRFGGLPAGRYTFSLRAETMSGYSDWVTAEFTVKAAPAGVVEPLAFKNNNPAGKPSGEPAAVRSRGLISCVRLGDRP